MKSYKYIDELLRRRSFPDFLAALNWKVDMKEWTECMGILKQISKITKDSEHDTLFDIGCGKRPTLGVLAALNLRSIKRVVCIDPQLDETLAGNIRNITMWPMRLKEYLQRRMPAVPGQPLIIPGKSLIACNHAHVDLKELSLLFNQCESWDYITCPCCVDNKLNSGTYFKDSNVWSPKNIYFISKAAN